MVGRERDNEIVYGISEPIADRSLKPRKVKRSRDVAQINVHASREEYGNNNAVNSVVQSEKPEDSTIEARFRHSERHRAKSRLKKERFTAVKAADAAANEQPASVAASVADTATAESSIKPGSSIAKTKPMRKRRRAAAALNNPNVPNSHNGLTEAIGMFNQASLSLTQPKSGESHEDSKQVQSVPPDLIISKSQKRLRKKRKTGKETRDTDPHINADTIKSAVRKSGELVTEPLVKKVKSEKSLTNEEQGIGLGERAQARTAKKTLKKRQKRQRRKRKLELRKQDRQNEAQVGIEPSRRTEQPKINRITRSENLTLQLQDSTPPKVVINLQSAITTDHIEATVGSQSPLVSRKGSSTERFEIASKEENLLTASEKKCSFHANPVENQGVVAQFPASNTPVNMGKTLNGHVLDLASTTCSRQGEPSLPYDEKVNNDTGAVDHAECLMDKDLVANPELQSLSNEVPPCSSINSKAMFYNLNDAGLQSQAVTVQCAEDAQIDRTEAPVGGFKTVTDFIPQEKEEEPSSSLSKVPANVVQPEGLAEHEVEISSAKPKKRKTGATSPYFTLTPSPRKKRRATPGQSCNEFPRLTQERFGLFQEREASDPFRLFIGVQFLNKTKGSAARPIFDELMSQYPTPQALANADEDKVQTMITSLGLQVQRTTTVLNIAKQWIEDPPQCGRRHRKLHYPSWEDGIDIESNAILNDSDPRRGAFEVAHLYGAGPYSIDSWRIFCRDRLRGLALDHKGTGALPNEDGSPFEPEWKRVVPLDKELRAYLRWMWLKEGWFWDPLTGKKKSATRELIERVERGNVVCEELTLDDQVSSGDPSEATLPATRSNNDPVKTCPKTSSSSTLELVINVPPPPPSRPVSKKSPRKKIRVEESHQSPSPALQTNVSDDEDVKNSFQTPSKRGLRKMKDSTPVRRSPRNLTQ